MAQYVNLQKINSISPCFFCMMSKKTHATDEKLI